MVPTEVDPSRVTEGCPAGQIVRAGLGRPDRPTTEVWMSVQENIELVRSITERGLNHGDVSFVDEVFAPSYVAHTRGLDLPKGPGAFKAAVSFWRQSFPDFHTSIEQMIGEGDFVASRFSTTGTHTG